MTLHRVKSILMQLQTKQGLYQFTDEDFEALEIAESVVYEHSQQLLSTSRRLKHAK